MRRPALDRSEVKALPGPSTNGSASRPQAMPVLSTGSASYPSAPPADLNGDLRPLLHALRSEMQVLSRKVDQIQPPGQYSGDASQGAEQALAAAEALPGRIAKAVAEALREQHKAMQVELGVLRVQLAADIESVHESLEQPAVSDQILPAVDARFEWLVNELSDRFVILGNEIARIDRHLTATDGDGATVQAQIDDALSPLLAAVERLTLALETWRPGALAGTRRR